MTRENEPPLDPLDKALVELLVERMREVGRGGTLAAWRQAFPGLEPPPELLREPPEEA